MKNSLFVGSAAGDMTSASGMARKSCVRSAFHQIDYFSAADIHRHIGEMNYLVSNVARSTIEDRADRVLVNAGRFLWIIDYD
jgi:hypothetical protein